MQLRRMTGGFGAFTVGSREGDVEPVPRRADDEPDLGTTSFDSVATDDRQTLATCVDELKQRSRQETVGGPGRNRPPVSTERDSQSDFRQDEFRRPSASKDNLNETWSLDYFDSRDRTVRIDSLDAAPRGINTSGRSQLRRGESSLSNVPFAVTSRLRGVR